MFELRVRTVNSRQKRMLRATTGLCCWLASVVSADAAVIGVDDVHRSAPPCRLATGFHFDDFRATIEGLGHTIRPMESFTAQDLQDLDMLIVQQPYGSYHFTEEEILAIGSYVMYHGGGLLVMGEVSLDEDDVENMNALTAQFGISYASTTTECDGHETNWIYPWPTLTTNIWSLFVDCQHTITTDYPSHDLTQGDGADNVLSVLDSAYGRAVFISDSNMWGDHDLASQATIATGDNRRLLINTINYCLRTPSSPPPNPPNQVMPTASHIALALTILFAALLGYCRIRRPGSQERA